MSSPARMPRFALFVALVIALVGSLGLPASGSPAGAEGGRPAPSAQQPVGTPDEPLVPAMADEDAAEPETAAWVAFGTKTATAPVPTKCAEGGFGGNRILPVYAYFGTQQSRFGAVKPYITDALKRADAIVLHSGRQTGGYRQLRLATDAACQPHVAVAWLPADAAGDFGRTAAALQGRGYNHPQRKYLVFAESRSMCGLGQMYSDDQAGGQNRNNRGPQFARVDLGCWSGAAVAHEVFHTLGAVQKTAPSSNTALHCRDERDAMCYAGSGGMSVYTSSHCTATLPDERLDCNKNDYFNTAPRAGSYLATRWNTARSAFLWGGGPAYQFAPAGVRGLALTRPTTGSVRLTWSAPAVSAWNSAATSYTVLRGTSLSTATTIATVTGGTFTDTTPLRGTYGYWVVGRNAGGDGTKVGLTLTR